MHCQCITKFGHALEPQDRQDMVPEGSEVILEVIAAGVCHTDLHMREGGLDLGRGQKLDYAARGIGLPLVLGHENVGRVVAAGPQAEGIDPGKTYLIYPWCGCGSCDLCTAGDEHLCMTPRCLGIHVDGGYATQIKVAHPRYLFDIGDLNPVSAAPLACSGLTTYSALKKLAGVIHSHTTVLFGAGGLGLMCTEMIQALGAKPPVVVDIDPVKRDQALKNGAKAVIDPRAEGAMEQIIDACGGAPMGVIDFVNAESTAELAFNVLGKGGSLVTVGLFGGGAPWPLPMITLKSARIQGSYVGSLNDFRELVDLARAGKLRPIPSTIFPLRNADDVLNQLEAGKIIGRAVLK
ncbi:alcohol dehydrogenase [Thalassovita sp.]|uniref:alcohol dehydrogenase n=1 Tax=Thalassovita sp. TaxID=1979401 RepID=UPI0029DE6B1B|nr:alcohol dehydrogenase [Thalassovita sp.]